MSDGDQLRQSWSTALNDAESHFRRLLSSSITSDWKRIPTPSDTSNGTSESKPRLFATAEFGNVVLHKRTSRSATDVYKVTLDIPTDEEAVSLDTWKAVLATPELREEWDPAVEEAQLVEMYDNKTRICKTKFTLGWPAYPRDAVIIARSFHDASTIIDISTSLPRSVDEPAYLRPSPPYVRSHVALFAWCVQYIPLIQQTPQPSSQPLDLPKRKSSLGGRLRVTCLWQHDMRASWNFRPSQGLPQQLCDMILGLAKVVKKRGSRIPMLTGYGNGVSIERIRFQIDREALTIEYAIVPEEEEESVFQGNDLSQGINELNAKKEYRRLTRSVECVIPASEGWDVQLSTKASSEKVEKLPWTANALKSSSIPLTPTSQRIDQTIFKVTHAPLPDDHSTLKVKIVLELSGPPGSVRLNGLPHPVQDIEERDPSSFYMSQSILQDVASTANLSFRTVSSIRTTESGASSLSTQSPWPAQLLRTPTERSSASEKSILSRVRRNYIYFSSLLQEPEAKWRRTTEARGVSITQLDSIDPTLIVYRAEATFVGVTIWDLYSALVSPGARIYWDKQHDNAVLLEDVNELTELWHLKTKPAWPVVGRDSVVLKTVYKSPVAIHVFSFSADEPHLFPSIPPVDPNIIRTQIDLQGWAVESLSPTTTLLTLLEQSDPKGWTNKTSIPQQMINSVAGVGEFAIKCGGPPVVARLTGAKANEIRYDHERLNFRIEYEGLVSRRSDSPAGDGPRSSAAQMPVIECELRCDIDSWASSLDIVVDPPPQSVYCLRRHRLSGAGGGLWITLTHDAVFVDDERLLIIVRKGPGKEKGLVMLNGSKASVDVEEISDTEIKALSKQKRVKPPRIPLDQPPVMGVMRRRRAEWSDEAESNGSSTLSSGTTSNNSFGWASAPKFPSPLARFLTTAVEQATSTTQQAVAAITPASQTETLSSSKPPMQHVLEVLSWVQEEHCRFSSSDWTLVTEKGLAVHRKLCPEISPLIPIHRGQRVIEGVSGEELASIVTQYGCRKQWDDRFDSASVFEAYGAECHSDFVVLKGSFPFRDRGFYLASVMARGPPPPSVSRRNITDPEQSSGSRNAIFCVSSSFSPDSITRFASTKYNPYGLPTGRVFVDGWIFETLDPYTTENYAIPSTRCTRFVGVDYAGSIPTAVNSMINSALPRAILAVDAYSKSISPLPGTRLPAPGLVVSESKNEEESPMMTWKLRPRDENRSLITTRYNPEGRTYRSSLLLMMPSRASRSPALRLDDVTPRPSTIILHGPPAATEALPTLPIDVMNRPRVQRSTSNSSTVKDSNPSRIVSALSARRPSTSAFTTRGELRHSTDLLVAEVVIDSKLYPSGYDIRVKSRARESGKCISLQPPEGTDAQVGDLLPILYAAYTLPASPLHSSGLNAEESTRHLVRLSLPTAQYQISRVSDPLTGETQAPPAKPQWLVNLDEKGAIVDIEINPAAGSKGVVSIDGKQVTVLNEKESLTNLGRDELQDDRTSKMAVLSRSAEEGDTMPEELVNPLALDDRLLDPSATTLLPSADQDNEDPEGPSTPPDANEAPSQQAQCQPEPQPASGSSGGLLSFLNAYPNPLSRFTGSPNHSTLSSANSSPRPSSRKSLPGALITVNEDLPPSSASAGSYTLSTIIIVALIAFLVGSLLRSLLSPADFIYVASDLKEAEERQTGWREIKRLLEVKYIVGGWDFQVAVVRRH